MERHKTPSQIIGDRYIGSLFWVDEPVPMILLLRPLMALLRQAERLLLLQVVVAQALTRVAALTQAVAQALTPAVAQALTPAARTTTSR